MPAGFVLERVIAFVQRTDKGEEAVVLLLPRADRLPVLVILVADRSAVMPAVGDHHDQGLTAPLGPGADHVHHYTGLVLVNLIEQRHMGPWPGLTVIGTDRAEETARAVMRQIPHFLATPGLLKPIRQQRRLIDHRHRIAKQDHGLILFRCSGVNLGAGFIVRGHTVKADPGCQRRLARALCGLDIAGAKAPKTVRAFPAKQAAEDKGLPWQQMEGLALVLAAIEAEHVLEVAHNPVGRVQIPE